jgi:hypothetical protein
VDIRSAIAGRHEKDQTMTASITHANHQAHLSQQVRAERAEQGSRFTRELLAGGKRAATAVWEALMRCAVAYERTAQERIMRELALSHPGLVAEMRAAQAAADADEARQLP